MLPKDSRTRKNSFTLSLLFLLLFCSSCLSERESGKVLRLGFTPSDQTQAERRQAFEALRDYLALETRLSVKLVRTNSYQPAIEAMKRGEVDIMNFGAQAYLIAENESAAEAFALRGDSDGVPNVYQSIIIAPSKTPFTSISQAVEAASSLHIVFTNKASTSGYLIAKHFFSNVGMDPETSFARTDFSNSHALSILEVSNGNADLANVSSRTLESLIQSGRVDPTAIKILWRSSDIPNGPVAYRSQLSEELKQKIRNAYFELPTKNAEAWQTVKQLYPGDKFVYIPVEPEAFDTLRGLRN